MSGTEATEKVYRGCMKGNMADRGMCPWLLQEPVDGGFAYRCVSETGDGAEARGVLCFHGNTQHVRCGWYVSDGNGE